MFEAKSKKISELKDVTEYTSSYQAALNWALYSLKRYLTLGKAQKLISRHLCS